MSNFLDQNWIHYSSTEIKELYNTNPSENKNFVKIKPNCIYFAVDDQWLEWCKSENFYTGTNEFKYKITENKDLKILDVSNTNILETYLDLDYFLKLNPNADIPKVKEISKFMGSYNWEKMKNDRYDDIYVSDKIVNTKDTISVWKIYDVETLCIWNTNKIKIQLESKTQ